MKKIFLHLFLALALLVPFGASATVVPITFFGGTNDAPPVAGPALWLDASDTSSIVSTSGSVSAWNDKSGNGYNAIQTNPSFRPVTGAATVNGLNAVRFSGKSLVLPSALYNLPNADNTLFIVTRQATNPAGDHWAIAGNGGGLYGIYIPNLGGLYGSNNNTPFTGLAVVGAPAETGITRVNVLRRTGSTVNIYRDGVEGSTGVGANATYTGLFLGAVDGSGNNSIEGDIAEVLIYPRNLSDVERATVTNYLSVKWKGLANPLRIANQNNVYHSGEILMGGTRNAAATRRALFLGRDQRTITVGFNNWYSNVSSEVAGSQNYSIVDVSLEAPNGVVVPVTFGGSRTATVTAGTALLLADEIPAARFGYDVIPKQSVFWAKYKYTIPTVGGNTLAFGWSVSSYAGNQIAWYDNTAITMSSTDTAGPYVPTGTTTGTNYSTPDTGVSVALFGKPVVDGVTLVGVGDSILAGQGDLSTNQFWGGGYFRRSMMNADYTAPIRNGILFAQPSAKYEVARFGTRWKSYLPYATVLLDELGQNNVGINDAATLEAYGEVVWQYGISAGTKVIRTLHAPETSSTDQWTTLANQTYLNAGASPGGTRDLVNQYYLADTSGRIDSVVTMNALRDATLPLKWFTNGTPFLYTDDGTHYSVGGNLVATAELRAVNDNFEPQTNNISPPVISGSFFVGGTLNCSTGTWVSSGSPTYSYQWLNNGANIMGATSSSYVVQPTDDGDALTCIVVRKDNNGKVASWSNTLNGIQLLAWYDASDTATITSSSNAVSALNDKSGNGHHLTQSNPTYRPVTGATVNGRNCIAYNTQYLNFPSALYSMPNGNNTVVNVIKRDTLLGADQFIMRGVTLFGEYFENSGNLKIANNTTYSGLAAKNQGNNLTTPSIIRHSRNGTVITVDVDQSAGFNGTAANTTITAMFLGAGDATGGNGISGKICETLIAQRALAANENLQVSRYLKTKWGTP